MVENTHQDSVHGRYHFSCLAAPGETKFKRIELDIDRNEDFYMDNLVALRAGRWFIGFPCEWAVDGNLPREKNDRVHSLSFDEVESLYKLETSGRQLRRGGQGQAVVADEESVKRKIPSNPRRLSYVGKFFVGIVIVHAKNQRNKLFVADAETMVYTKANKQFRDCSNGALELVKKDKTIEITLPNNIGFYKSTTIEDYLMEAVCTYGPYNYGKDCVITDERDLDHILFSLPYGVSDDSPGKFRFLFLLHFPFDPYAELTYLPALFERRLLG